MRMRRPESASAMAAIRFELCEGGGALVLDVAEMVELLQVPFMRALPRLLVGLSPQAAIVGRTGIGIERHGFVRPHAVALKPLAPLCDQGLIVLHHLDQ